MPETAAVRRAEEPVRPGKHTPLFDEIQETFNAISRRAYEIFEGSGESSGHDLEDWFRAEREFLHPVQINIEESDDILSVKAEVPGFSEKELEINLEPHRFTIKGKRETKSEEKKGKTLWAESCSNQVLRIVDLPVEIEPNKVNAVLKHGVLELTMPKVARVQILRIHPKTL